MIAQGDGTGIKDFSSVSSLISVTCAIVGLLGVAPAHMDTTATMTKRLSCLPGIQRWRSVMAERGRTKNGHSKAFTWDLFWRYLHRYKYFHDWGSRYARIHLHATEGGIAAGVARHSLQ